MGTEGGYHYCDPWRGVVRKAVMAHTRELMCGCRPDNSEGVG